MKNDLESGISGEIKGNWTKYSTSLIAAVSYGATNVSLILANKYLFSFVKYTDYGVVYLIQSFISLFAVSILGLLGLTSLNRKLFSNKYIFLVPIAHIAYVLFSFLSTEAVDVPTYTVLRRLSDWFLIGAEFLQDHSLPSSSVFVAIILRTIGAIVAGFNDLSFSVKSYSILLVTNFLGTLYLLCIKIATKEAKFDAWQLTFVISLISCPAMLIWNWEGVVALTDLPAEHSLRDWRNCVLLFLIGCQGLLLTAANIFCIQYTSPLTTTMIAGISKSITVAIGLLSFTTTFPSGWYLAGVILSLGSGTVFSLAKYVEYCSKAKPTDDESHVN